MTDDFSDMGSGLLLFGLVGGADFALNEHFLKGYLAASEVANATHQSMRNAIPPLRNSTRSSFKVLGHCGGAALFSIKPSREVHERSLNKSKQLVKTFLNTLAMDLENA